MLEVPEKLNYAEWDNVDYALPQELILKENSFLHEAVYVFYAAGGYDFFKVVNSKKYATRWLDFMGDKKDFNDYENPLSEKDRNSLIEQGVPNLFTNKII